MVPIASVFCLLSSCTLGVPALKLINSVVEIPTRKMLETASDAVSSHDVAHKLLQEKNLFNEYL